MRRLASPYVLLVLNMAVWSGNWIVGRYLRGQITPLGLNFWRWCLVLAWLLPFTWRELWRERAALLREWKVMLPLGVLGIALFNTLIYLALSETTAVNGVLINSVIPVAIVVLSWAFLRERISGRQAVGILVSLLGVLAIVSKADPAALLQLHFNRGDLWAMVAVPVWATYSVLLRRRPQELGPMAFLAAQVLIGVAAMLPFSLVAHAEAPQVTLVLPVMLGLVYVALFSSLFGVASYNYGVAKLGPNVAGLFLHLVPAFTTGLAWLFLGERLRLYHLIGIALIFSGIYLTSIGARRAPIPEAPLA